jgi:c-di-GMP-related signal transduction protein
MTAFVARQPIFDGRGEVFAYELLFRPGSENLFGAGDRDHASARVIEDSLALFDFDALTAGRRAFVNVTRQVLVGGLFRALPSERTVVELLETVDADEEVLAACRALKEAGYLLALDDFVLRPALEPLVPLADFLKIDFLETTAAERAEWLERLSGWPVRLLAEKVETREEYEQAVQEGFTYFQGYFFERPEMVPGRALPPFKQSALRVLAELQTEQFDYERIEAIVRQEQALAERFLADLRVSARGKAPVESVRQAHVLLGSAAFRRWATLVSVAALGDDRPRALVATCLVRARFSELLALRAAAADEADVFLAGLLSGLGGLVNRSAGQGVAQLAPPRPVADALAGRPGPGTEILGLALAYETGDWTQVGAHCRRLGLFEERVPPLFRQAVEWANAVFGT